MSLYAPSVGVLPGAGTVEKICFVPEERCRGLAYQGGGGWEGSPTTYWQMS